MVTFQPVQLADRAHLMSYHQRQRMEGSDGIFGNSYMWRNAYQIRWAIIEDSLCFMANRGTRDFFLPPMGATGDEALKKAIETLNTYSIEAGFMPEYRGVSAGMKEKMEAFFPGGFEWQEDRDNFDYTYRTEDLINLAGRTYHGKKNHVNQFRRLYSGYEYQTITPNIVPACIDYALEWCRQRGCDSDPSLGLERDAIIDCLEHFEELNFKGAVLKVAGKIQALTYGEQLNSDTAIIHVEKANGELKGIYAAINQEFLTYAWPDMTYVNREEDMGEPGLRKAKESYKPFKMIEKYIAVGK